jgi:Na+-driven multidrug efflux pump
MNAIGVLAEGIVWQVMSSMAAHLGNAALAAHDLSLSILGLLSIFGSGIGAAIGVRLGAALGDKRITCAKKTYRVGIMLTFAIGIFLSLVEMVGGNMLANLASTDSKVLQYMDTLKPIVALIIGLQLIWWPIYEVLLKQGRSVAAGFVTAICGVVLMLPMSYILTQYWGLEGIWFGILGGYSVAMGIELVMIQSSDWDLLAKNARMRNEIVSPPWFPQSPLGEALKSYSLSNS